MMNAKEKEYMDYLIHNRNQLTEQISRHLNDLLLLQNKLDIAVKALKEYADESSWVDCKTVDDDFEYIARKCAWYIDVYGTAQKALKEINLVGTSAKE